MYLYLIRHGESEGMEKPDAERELTPQGLADVEKIAQHITAQVPRPTKLFSSPLKRAVQTAEFFEKGWNLSVEIQDWLVASAPASQVLDALKQYTDADCALVGHLPNLGLVLGTLVWGPPAKEIVIPKGGVAHLNVEALEPGAAKMRWLLTPETIG